MCPFSSMLMVRLRQNPWKRFVTRGAQRDDKQKAAGKNSCKSVFSLTSVTYCCSVTDHLHYVSWKVQGFPAFLISYSHSHVALPQCSENHPTFEIHVSPLRQDYPNLCPDIKGILQINGAGLLRLFHTNNRRLHVRKKKGWLCIPLD